MSLRYVGRNPTTRNKRGLGTYARYVKRRDRLNREFVSADFQKNR